MIEARAAVRVRNGDAEEAKLCHSLDELGRVTVFAIDLGCFGQHFVQCELSRHLLDGELIFGRCEVHWPLNCAGRLARNAPIPSR